MSEENSTDEITRAYKTWDEFLIVWPISRLREMTLEEYTKAGSKDTFAYWLEIRLGESGNIAGGSAFKFGVFSRKSTKDKQSAEGLSYTTQYGWYTIYGTTVEEAFERVRVTIVAIATAAAAGDLETIEDAAFGDTLKWKIAFHYQDRNHPSVIAVFKRVALDAFLGTPSNNKPLGQLYRQVLDKRDPDEDLLAFGGRVWSVWASKESVIWKLSHGTQSFSADDLASLRARKLALVHKNTGIGQAEKFAKAPIGTLFYLCHGNAMQLLARLTTDVQPSSHGDGEWLQRAYEVFKFALSNQPFELNSKKWTPRGNSTFWEIPKRELPAFESTLLAPYFGLQLNQIDALTPLIEETEIEDEEEEEELPQDMQEVTVDVGPLNRILYGPPGTGKTYRAIAEAVSLIEGLPYQALMAPAEYAETKRRFDGHRASGQIEFVTFHPSYAYQDFIEGIRPKTEGGALSYAVEDGVLKRLALRARENWAGATGDGGRPRSDRTKLKNHVLVIDEINRGNVAKIFGELITLIEDDKRLGAPNQLTVRLPYTPTDSPFGLPPNLYLVGTMNTSDRSIALIDTALRRRFSFVELMPDASVPTPIPDCDDVDVFALMNTLNERIEYMFDRDHTIGHAYFCGMTSFDDLVLRLRTKIIPLLQEYFHEDWAKIRLIFGDGPGKPDHQHVVSVATTSASRLFGAQESVIEDRPRYQIAPVGAFNVAMVLAIYK